MNKDEKDKKEKFYIATAIVYSSKKPHIGNDFELVFSDAIARFKKMSGHDVFFSTGTDEHGQKVAENAEKAGISPKEYVDKITGGIQSTYKRLNIGYDKFIRTTDEYHREAVKKIFVKLYENGDIYKGNYEGLYCVPCESFYTASQVKDTGGLCPDCGRELREAKEEAYFLKLSKYQKKLEEHIEKNPDFLLPAQRKREIVNNFLKPGLSDVCVSRSSVSWGVPVEFDPGHVIYVWIDALSNYITLLGYNPENIEQPELYQKYWPCDLHVVGKDIYRFHAIYLPVILFGLGIEQPKQILGHQWLLMDGEKMSKSKGNVIYTDDVLDRFGADMLRYYMLSEMTLDRDGGFTYANFIRKYNADLVNTLSNLVNRTVVMTEKYFGGETPMHDSPGDFDDDLKETALTGAKNWAEAMEEYKTAEAIDSLLAILNRANKYIDETEPWALSKDEDKKARLGTVLYNLLESIRISGVLLSPIMPETSEKIFSQLGASEKSYESAFLFGGLKSGARLERAEPIFMRLDEKKILDELEQA
ncbi:MAG: methionine--tRNA ligase [Oscillospiraceae bacterium]|nr:methionine--tRNA ligase [Oscillospiraceae bacterium]